jgi:formylglycine-generating enzyme required for sulfatase activity
MNTTAPTYYFDLSGFLHRLSNEGFSIGVDTHILIQKVIGDLPLGYEPQVLQTLLMPILCKSEKQQVIYQAVFRQFFNRSLNTEINSLPEEKSVKEEVKGKRKITRKAIQNYFINPLMIIGIGMFLLLLWRAFYEPNSFRNVGLDYPILVIIVFIAIVLIGLIWALILMIKEANSEKPKPIAKQEHGITPDDVNKIYADLVPVNLPETLTQSIARLRLREPLGVQRLDVANTIKASIQNLGFFTPKYQDYTKYTEYLILIQADNADDHKAKLYNTFFEELAYRNIPAVRYYFRTSPRYCYNEQETEATLETVLHDNAHCVLLMFAELNTFISLKSNTAFAWTKPLTDLPQRYLMLPFGSAMEAVIARPLEGIFDAILPATELGFEQLENYLNQGDLKDDFTRFIRLRQAVPTFPIRIETEAELQQLPELLPENSRKYLLKWIVACAVYPDFSWKMTLFLGQLLADDTITYNSWDNLRQLARISWFKEAYMPQSIRRILLEKTDKQTLNWLTPDDIAYIKKGIHQVYAANKRQGFTGETERLLTELYKAPQTEAEKQTIKSKLENSVDYVTATLVDSRLKDMLFFDLPNDALETENTPTETTATIKPDTNKTDTTPTEKEAFDKATAENTIAAFEAFLQQFPNGEFAALAKQLLKEISLTPDPFAPLMLKIKGGAFRMGSNEHDREKPIHEVVLNDFYIGKYPVTVEEYLAFCEATKSNYPEWLEEGSNYHIKNGSDNYYQNKGYEDEKHRGKLPIVGVSWYDAVAYAKWLSEKTGQNYRLPTEAEWEYAARGGQQSKGYKYAGSDNLDKVGWFIENSGSQTHPVGQKQPNELGLYDMSGNVWEWCQDHWHDNYNGAPENGSAWTSGENSAYRVLRGGSWISIAGYCRSANRSLNTPDSRLNYYGFRIAL